MSSASEVNPSVQITQPTPKNEKSSFILDADLQPKISQPTSDGDSSSDDDDLFEDTITEQPLGTPAPTLFKTTTTNDNDDDKTKTSDNNTNSNNDNSNDSNDANNTHNIDHSKEQTSQSSVSSSDDSSSITVSETGSGYQRDNNECTEFCIELAMCFGMFEACCPSDGEGCLTSTATFCGNILFACCKC